MSTPKNLKKFSQKLFLLGKMREGESKEKIQKLLYSEKDLFFIDTGKKSKEIKLNAQQELENSPE